MRHQKKKKKTDFAWSPFIMLNSCFETFFCAQIENRTQKILNVVSTWLSSYILTYSKSQYFE